MYECPKRASLQAIQAALDVDADAKFEGEEVEKALNVEIPRMGALKFLSALQKKTWEQRESIEKGLMYVEAWVNHKLAKNTTVDSGATHNFMTETEVNRLNIKWHRDSGKMKVVNSVALPIIGIVRKTTLKLGTWSSLVDFVIVKMDDFDVVLGMEFLLEHKVIPIPLENCLVITRSTPTVAQTSITT